MATTAQPVLLVTITTRAFHGPGKGSDRFFAGSCGPLFLEHQKISLEAIVGKQADSGGDQERDDNKKQDFRNRSAPGSCFVEHVEQQIDDDGVIQIHAIGVAAKPAERAAVIDPERIFVGQN